MKWYFYTMPKYEFITWEEDGMWTSHAPSISGVYGVGKTASKAEEDLEEAVDLLFEYLSDVGEALPKPRKLRVGSVRV